MNLRQWLKVVGINMTVFADMLNIHRSYLYVLTRGSEKPSQKLLDRLKKVTMGIVTSFSEKALDFGEQLELIKQIGDPEDFPEDWGKVNGQPF